MVDGPERSEPRSFGGEHTVSHGGPVIDRRVELEVDAHPRSLAPGGQTEPGFNVSTAPRAYRSARRTRWPGITCTVEIVQSAEQIAACGPEEVPSGCQVVMEQCQFVSKFGEANRLVTQVDPAVERALTRMVPGREDGVDVQGRGHPCLGRQRGVAHRENQTQLIVSHLHPQQFVEVVRRSRRQRAPCGVDSTTIGHGRFRHCLPDHRKIPTRVHLADA